MSRFDSPPSLMTSSWSRVMTSSKSISRRILYAKSAETARSSCSSAFTEGDVGVSGEMGCVYVEEGVRNCSCGEVCGEVIP